MDVSVETTGAIGRKMTVKVPAEQLDGAVAARLKRLARTAKIPGFRPGKIPMKVIESRFANQALAEAAECHNRGPNPFNFEFSVLHVDPGAPNCTARTIREIAGRFDALIICAAEDPEIVVALRGFAATDKPGVALATDFGPDVLHIHVGPDDYRAGMLAGHLMGRFLSREGGKVLVVAGMSLMVGQRQRREGFRAAIAEGFSAIQIVGEVESGENGEKAGLLVARTLSRHPDLRGIYNASADAAEIAEAL